MSEGRACEAACVLCRNVGMDAPDQSVASESKQDDLLSLIAVSATELEGVIREGGGSDVSELIARVLDERQAA